MRVVAKIHLSEVNRWAARLRRQRSIGKGLTAWRPFGRTLLWAQFFTNQFARRFMSRLSGERTLLRAATMHQIRAQHFASQWQLLSRIWGGITLHAGNHILVFPTPHAAPGRSVPQAIVSQEVHGQLTTILRSDFLRHASSNFLREIQRHTKNTTLMERAATRSVITHLAAKHSSVASQANHPAPEVVTLADRLRRQTQRTEEPWTPPDTVLLRRTPVPILETQSIEAAPASFSSRPSMMNSPWPMPVPQPGININQITDEVVRKLDSRLIAARERFGKI